MQQEVFALRRKYGNHYGSVFPELDLIVPWKTLSLGEFLEYDHQYNVGYPPATVLEDEIFKKCVLNESIVLNADLLPAGVVTTTVSQILNASGPQSPEQINTDFNLARYATDNFMNYVASLVCQVFPAYTFESVLSLSYADFMKVAASAERRLLEMGLITEPIQAFTQGEEQPQPRQRRHIDVESRLADLNKPQQQTYRDVLTDLDPPKFVLTNASRSIQDKEIQMSIQGHDQLDIELWKHDALQGLASIYPELVEKVRAGEVITPESILETRGRTPTEVRQNFNKYTDDVLSGKIKPEETKSLISQGPNKQKKPKKVRRPR